MSEKTKVLRPGTLLQNGKYRIVRFISSGGFGCTYEAVHTVFDERVAIKELFVEDCCNRDSATGLISVGVESKRPLIQRLYNNFIDEAKAQRRMSHPYIVRVSDVFEENGTAYYVMDYIDGCSLETLAKQRQQPLSEAEATGYVRQIAHALAYVHSCRRLHLDVKPGNIMVDRRGNAILIDFGASKQYDEAGKNESTLKGFTKGYAPLEQWANQLNQFSPATDIYSLGATLYRLLTGETPADSVSRSANGDVLSPLPANVSQPTRRALKASMELRLADRPQSIEEFLNILDDRSAAYDGQQNYNAASEQTGTRASAMDSTERHGADTVKQQPGGAGAGGGSNGSGGGGYSNGAYNNMDEHSLFSHGRSDDDEKSSSGMVKWFVIGAVVAVIAFFISFPLIRGCQNSDGGEALIGTTADSTVVRGHDEHEGHGDHDYMVDLGLTHQWSKKNQIVNGTTLMTLEQIEKFLKDNGLPYEIPSVDDWKELRDKCEWTWTPSPAGYMVTGPSGGRIYIPADGMVMSDGEKLGVGEYGEYITSDKDKIFSFTEKLREFESNVKDEKYSVRLIYCPHNHE